MLDRFRDRARRAFEGIAENHEFVEFPHIPFYAYHEMPAVFADEAYSSMTLLSAVQQLTGVLADGGVTGAESLNMSSREEARRAYESLDEI